MESSDLSFFTAQELIAELMRRKTFLGVVVQSEKEWRGEGWGEERPFQVHFNSNLETTEASRLLGRVSEFMDLYHS